MPTAPLPTRTEDQIDDLLYLARTGSTSDLLAEIDILTKTLSTTPSAILAATVDAHSGNGMLHMASANGHTETLKSLLALPSSTPSSTISRNLQNASGNTPLHWAALNGHLEAVKALVGAGADVTVINSAGHDAVYEAEVNEKNEVAEWLLTEGKGLERGVKGSERGAREGCEGGEGGVEGEGLEVGEEGEEVVMRDGEMGEKDGDGAEEVVMREGKMGEGG